MMDFFDILLIFISAISTGLFVGIVYLVYIFYRRRRLKSEKLSDDRNIQIKRSFVISFCVLFCFILFIGYFFKDYGRTPSKERLERIANVKLPPYYKVLKDEYQDMMQDYAIHYDIQFDNNATIEFIKSIQTSKFYNKNSFHKGAWKERDFVLADSIMAVWCKSPKGYDFIGKEGNGFKSYTIELDTLTNILNYTELD